MKRLIYVLAAVVLAAASANAQMMMGEGGMQGMGGMGRMGGMMSMHGSMGMPGMMDDGGVNLMAACMADLDELGLSGGARKAIEDRRFEVRKKAIRIMADMRVLRMEAGRLLEERSFDPKAVEAKLSEVSAREAELRAVHVGLLYELGKVLTDEQWTKLKAMAAMMDDGGCGKCMQMRMMHGRGSMMNMMDGGMPMMPMMPMGGDQGTKGGGDDHSGHHPEDKGEAERFFKQGN